MEPYYARDGIVIYNCDCREVGDCLEASSIDSIVTDPPYALTANKKGGSGAASVNLDSPYGRARIGTGNGGGGFMGKAWDSALPPIEVWQELLGVCKPGAFLLSFGGTRTFHRLACAIEDAGWEIRDCINWLYGSGFPKSLDISKAIDKVAGAEREKVAVGNAVKRMIPGADQDKTGSWIKDNGREYQPGVEIPSTDAAKQWQGWGTALKPAWEPIIVAMKPLDGTFAQNALKHGVAGMNIDGCRVGDFVNTTPPGTDRYNQANYEQGYRPNAYQSNGRDGEASADKRYTKEVGTNFSATPGQRGGDVKGRFPANLIHDGSDEVLAGFPQQTSGANPTRRGSQKFRNAYGEFEGQEECVAARGAESGSASRFFYCAKASKKDRGEGNTHPTVKPHELMKYLLQLVATPTGGIVLDPFMGSGSTLVAAKALGRKAIGIEISKEYCDIAIARLAE